MTMPPIHAYIITGDFDESIKFALARFTARNGRLPTAVWLHPDRIPDAWPPAWPPVYPNNYLNRHIVGLEAQTVDQPNQLRLI
jgi:hypothetical protein